MKRTSICLIGTFAPLLPLILPNVAARDFVNCSPTGLPPATLNTTALVNNLGFNLVSLYACTAAVPSNVTCAPGQPDVYPCDLILGQNVTQWTRLTVNATALVMQYQSPQAFSWHPIVSSPAAWIAWPVPDQIVNIPYPSPDTILCDVDSDCPTGVPCVPAPAPPRCASMTPSPGPSPPPPVPVPTPQAGPAAATCNVTGEWFQHSLALHSADAFISIVAGPSAGEFTFACTSGRNLCPNNSSAVNGTGQLSTVDSTFTLSPDGLATQRGIINNTLGCQVMSLLSGTPSPVEWDFQPPNVPPPLNLDVTMASFLGSGARQLVGTGIAILASTAPSIIAVSGNGQVQFSGVTPVTVLNGSADSNGTIVVLSVDTTKPRGSGGKVLAVIKVGDRIDHLRATSSGSVAIVGSFGVAVVTGVAAGAPQVAWHDDLSGIEPGSCGVCCSFSDGGSNNTCRVDIGDDGVVIVNYVAQDMVTGGWMFGAYTATGQRFLQDERQGAQITSVAVDAANKQVMVGWFYDSNTGREPMVMPAVDAISYAKLPTHVAYTEMPWDAHVYRQPGPCDGDVADGRVMGLRIGRDGTLLYMGRSDGGDTPFFCGLRNSSRVVPMAQIDSYTSAYNMQSQAITNMLRVDAVTGEVIVGQLQLVRLPSTGGNTLFTLGAQSDAAGNVYLLQNAGCCLPNMANLTVNGQQLDGLSDSAALHILDHSMTKRKHWTHFSLLNSTDGGYPIDIDVQGSTVALLINSHGSMVTAGALPGTAGSDSGASVGYLIVLPTLA